jgi:hypothetical protein
VDVVVVVPLVGGAITAIVFSNQRPVTKVTGQGQSGLAAVCANTPNPLAPVCTSLFPTGPNPGASSRVRDSQWHLDGTGQYGE